MIKPMFFSSSVPTLPSTALPRFPIPKPNKVKPQPVETEEAKKPAANDDDDDDNDDDDGGEEETTTASVKKKKTTTTKIVPKANRVVTKTTQSNKKQTVEIILPEPEAAPVRFRLIIKKLLVFS